MEGRIDDLNGLTVEVITNVSFDDYNEEIRLNPKRILSKYYYFYFIVPLLIICTYY